MLPCSGECSLSPLQLWFKEAAASQALWCTLPPLYPGQPLARCFYAVENALFLPCSYDSRRQQQVKPSGVLCHHFIYQLCWLHPSAACPCQSFDERHEVLPLETEGKPGGDSCLCSNQPHMAEIVVFYSVVAKAFASPEEVPWKLGEQLVVLKDTLLRLFLSNLLSHRSHCQKQAHLA